jgi:long-chain acyl-CoA synthetase
MKSAEIPFNRYQKITDALLVTTSAHGDLPFSRIRCKGGFTTYTYRETLSRVKKIGSYLKKRGFAPGGRAAVLGENCPEWMFSHLGILWAGGTVVPLDSRATPSEWAHLMRHSESKFLFVSSAFYEDITELKETIPTLQEIVSFDGNGQSSLPYIFESFDEPPEPEDRVRDDIAVIIYTSGTTGTSKGVMLTHGNLLANIEQSLKILDISENDRFFSVLPIHHVFEGTVGFLLPLTSGSSVTFSSSMKSKELLEDLRDTRPTVFLVVPLLLEKLHLGIMSKRGYSTGLRPWQRPSIHL